ncbi:hypothetical protein DFH07DRAFT_970066 [Mycena maculata]|uniref:DNA binding HTH domain-containing protein n=1 Tax=Mycena maculata TaxID=230809 RepID=A0AAD7HTD0_9AGAR|nr:hypothetical protein DFH07DRAFT_970066 [Mycena maculata]
MEGDGAPRTWVESVANILGPLVYELQVAALAAEGIERDEIEFLQPVAAPATGKRGRPKKHIDPNYLKEATASNRNIKLASLSAALGVHRNTLRKRMRELGVHKKFDDLSDDKLDQLTREYKRKKPTSGLRALRTFAFLARPTEGLYADPLDGIHPDAINRYYGVEGAHQRRHGATGAGHALDEEGDLEHSDDDSELDPEEELENQIQADQAGNIRHSPVKVARHKSPFEEPEQEAAFLELLDVVLSQPEVQPEDYGVLEEEWEDEDYPETETIRTGTNGKELVVVLPRDDWLPHAVQWAQALDLFNRVLDEIDDV